VLCINRGRKPLLDTFDGRHVQMPAGHFTLEFDAASHFHRRLIVPGTRSLVSAESYTSFIGIYGTVDGRVKFHSEKDCEPFTDEQLERWGERLEGLDRSEMPNRADREVTAVATGAVAASMHRASRPGIDVSAQATADAEAAAAEVLAPPTESATREAEHEADREGLPRPRATRKR